MKDNIINAVSLLLTLLMLSGCSMFANTQQVSPDGNQVKQKSDNDLAESSYYYYTKGEFHKQKGEFEAALDTILKAVEIDPDSLFLQKELIGLYLRLKNTDKAMETAEEIVAENPDNTDYLFILAKLKQMLKRKKEAREIYLKILQLNPDEEDIYMILGRMYMDDENLDEAFLIYTKMAEHFPDSYVAHFFLGKIHMEKKNPDYAEAELLKTIELNDELIEPRFELIKIYREFEDEDSGPDPRIVSIYKAILNIEKENIKAALELPLYYHKRGQEDKARELFKKMGEKSAETRGMSMLAAKEFLGSERFKDAAIVFTGMLNGAPDNSTLHYLAGMSFDSLEETNMAITHFLKIKPKSEHYKKTMLHIAFLYNENEDKDKAIQFLEQKHDEFPQDLDIILYLASFYEDAKEYDKGLQILNSGLGIAPKNVTLLFRLGVIQDKSGDKPACVATMKNVINLDPDHASALNYLGYTYAEKGINLDEAEKLISRALIQKPDDGFITDSLGWVYYQKGLYKKAVEYLEKAVELTDADPVITEHLGDAYQKEKRLDKALEAYKKAISNAEAPVSDLKKKIEELEKIIHK